MIATILALYLLALLDGGFSGICAASGQNARIHKVLFYVKSFMSGAIYVHAICILGLVALTLATFVHADPNVAMEEMARIGERMAMVLGSYAAIILGLFLVRIIPSIDLRSATSIIAFGPLTLLRPIVVLFAVAWGLATNPSTLVTLATIFVGANMLLARKFVVAIWFRLHQPGSAGTR